MDAGNIPLRVHARFAYHRSVDADRQVDALASRIAAAIGAPARARMLYCLVDGRPRTSTELSLVAEVTPPTATAHLQRLARQQLVTVTAEGRRRLYRLGSAHVAAALEALSVLAGGRREAAVPAALSRLRAARTCYDHLAGLLGVSLFDRLGALGWIQPHPRSADAACDLTADGATALARLGVDVDAARERRRRFAYGCVDWSERRPHLGGALGAALLDAALGRGWVRRVRDSRALEVTAAGQRELLGRFGLRA